MRFVEIFLCIFLVGTLLCEIALVVAVFKVIRIFNDWSIPWHLLGMVADAEKWPQVSGGPAPPVGDEKGRGSIDVGELPPEVIAPSLKGKVSSTGFGSSAGNTNSDTQLHQGNPGSAGNQGGEPTSGDDSPDSGTASPTQSKSHAARLHAARKARTATPKPGIDPKPPSPG